LLVAPDLEQQVTDLLGVFARAGWADGNVDIPFLNAGGLGILSGEGHLPNPGLEKSLDVRWHRAGFRCYWLEVAPTGRATADRHEAAY
jgi:hypothetical protein